VLVALEVAKYEPFHGAIVEPVGLFLELSVNCCPEKNANKTNSNPKGLKIAQ
jgi:hypothetical protein